VPIETGRTAPAARARRVRLDDGRVVRIRPIAGSDTAELRAMHLRLSPLSISRRFFALLRELPLAQAARCTHVDGVDRAALVAESADGSIVGVARYDRTPGTVAADFAIVVEDAYQQHGLGTLLLSSLADLAQKRRVDHFTADVLSDNRPMFRTLRDAGMDVQTHDINCGVDHLVLAVHS
jgi:acetyltransferase